VPGADQVEDLTPAPGQAAWVLAGRGVERMPSRLILYR
jgi:hypothetical protein